MKKCILISPRHLELVDAPIPAPSSDEVLVKVLSVGLCGSDIHLYANGASGRYVLEEPLVLGHEVSGVIVTVGADVDNARIGERVSIEPLIANPHSSESKRGRYNLDPELEFFATPPVDGALAQYVTIPAHLAFAVPDSVSDDAAALLEPLSVAIHAVRTARISPGDRVLISGAGPIGILLAQTARVFGAIDVAVTDIDPFRRENVLKFGATQAIDAADAHRLSSLPKVDAFLDASGAQAAIQSGLSVVRPGGFAMMVGVGAQDMNIPVGLIRDQEIVFTGICRYVNTWPTAVVLAASGQIELDGLITGRYSLKDTARAFDATAAPGALKIVVQVAATEGSSQ